MSVVNNKQDTFICRYANVIIRLFKFEKRYHLQNYKQTTFISKQRQILALLLHYLFFLALFGVLGQASMISLQKCIERKKKHIYVFKRFAQLIMLLISTSLLLQLKQIARLQLPQLMQMSLTHDLTVFFLSTKCKLISKE